jgi:hypothetical protein
MPKRAAKRRKKVVRVPRPEISAISSTVCGRSARWRRSVTEGTSPRQAYETCDAAFPLSHPTRARPSVVLATIALVTDPISRNAANGKTTCRNDALNTDGFTTAIK